MRAQDRRPLKPSRLWKEIPADHRLDAALAFWADGEDVASQAEAVEAIARHLKFRARSVLALPVDKRARYLSSLQVLSDSLAARLLISYHLTHQRPMMAAFLDALGVPHQDGLITAEKVTLPDAAACQAAARDLMKTFPAEEASIYFATLVMQDPDTWASLKDFVARESAGAART